MAAASCFTTAVDTGSACGSERREPLYSYLSPLRCIRGAALPRLRRIVVLVPSPMHAAIVPRLPRPSAASSCVHSESAVDSPFGAEMDENGTKNGERTDGASGRPPIPTMGHTHSAAHAQQLWKPTLNDSRSCIHSKDESRLSSLQRICIRIIAFSVATCPPHSPPFPLHPSFPPTRLAIAGACYNSITSLVGIASLACV